MAQIPSFLLKKLYRSDTLQSTNDGFTFILKNSIGPATLTGILELALDGAPCDLNKVTLSINGAATPAPNITSQDPLPFPWGKELRVTASNASRLTEGRKHKLQIGVLTREVGELRFEVADRVAELAAESA